MQIFTLPDYITRLQYHTKKTKYQIYKYISYSHHTQIILRFFKPSIRMSEKNIKFRERKVNKSNFHLKMEDIDINKILVSQKESYGKEKNSFKYFFGYVDDDVIRPFCKECPQMICYIKCFDSNKTMSFKINDNRLLKKYTKIWETVSNLLSTEFDSEPVYGDNDRYIKTKLKLYGDKINKNFQGKKIPKENESYKSLSLIMLDSVIKANKKHYPQTLLEECKYEIKKNRVENLINDDLDLSLSDESDNDESNGSDNEKSNGQSES